MKIIRPGLPKEELERRLKETKRFECEKCGCIFEADKGEYTHTTQYNETHYYCKCPNCKIHNAYEVKWKIREIERDKG